MDVVVPDLGDFSDVEIIEVLVKAGDRIEPEQPLLTLETEKATVDIPSPAAGVVRSVAVSVGDRVSAGDVVLVLDAAAADAQSAEAGAGADRTESTEAGATSAAPEPPAAAAPATEGEAPAPQTVTVPDLGDFADVEVIEVLVGVGDEVAAEQGLITLETEKATLDVPAPMAGRVVELKLARGARVSSGDPILVLEPREAQKSAAPAKTGSEAAVTVSAPSAAAPAPRPSAAAAPAAGMGLPPIDERTFARAHASPAVRKFARELGVDLGRVKGSGRKGRVTADDVKAFVKQALQGGMVAAPALPKVPEVDFAKFGPIELVPLTRIQKIAGPRLHASWVNIPHVTQHDEADITELEARRQALKDEAAQRGVRLTPLAFVLRACVLMLAEHPRFKASLSADGASLVMKQYTHLGFAADTEDGLLVPVIRDADQLDVFGIAKALGELSERAREGKLSPKELQGGVFTVSSLGGIGGTAFTPVVNAPEVAILGLSRAQWKPVYDGTNFVPRLMLPLSLSYDHRVIDGAQAVRFTTAFGAMLADVDRLLEPPR
jgi:pyruvate dehydrogenase E2 component (dihydrolipoamide acetyltransferase)